MVKNSLPEARKYKGLATSSNLIAYGTLSPLRPFVPSPLRMFYSLK
jgi:hypothetical protein